MLYLVASVGEEIWEGVGLAQVVDSIHPDCVIVGEPTNLRLGISQRGRARLVFRVSGLAGHSSADDQTGNAIYRMGHLIERLAQHRLPSGTPLGSGIQAPIELISNPYPSTSILPVTCSLTIDRRLVLGETLEGVVADYRSVLAGLPSSRVDIDTVAYTSYTGQSFHLADFHPAWSTPRDSPLVQACLRGLASAQIETGVYAVPYCTNASYSAGQIGIPAVVFGPGDIAQAHAIDEYLDTAELQRAAQGYAALAREICQGAGQ
jgi:acetylornithine deacetylase/succinyl-diaminopimelate desuccinylase-like protein